MSFSKRIHVRDCMVRRVFTLNSDDKVLVASEIMDWAHARHVPVIDETGALVGMVSHRDILKASLSSLDQATTAADRKIHLSYIELAKVMRTPVTTIAPDALVQDAARLMRELKIGCLPVVEKGKLIGIISEHDLLHLVAQL
jgi:CBS domain-containing membrane protein